MEFDFEDDYRSFGSPVALSPTSYTEADTSAFPYLAASCASRATPASCEKPSASQNARQQLKIECSSATGAKDVLGRSLRAAAPPAIPLPSSWERPASSSRARPNAGSQSREVGGQVEDCGRSVVPDTDRLASPVLDSWTPERPMPTELGCPPLLPRTLEWEQSASLSPPAERQTAVDAVPARVALRMLRAGRGSELPPEPSEDAFVSAKPRARQQEYEKLEAWLGAGGDARQFQLWFREMLMDADQVAFAAACSAVGAHYRQGAGSGDVERKSLVKPKVWLPALAERIRAACAPSFAMEHGLRAISFVGSANVADLMAAAMASCKEELQTLMTAFLQNDGTCLAALSLLCVCADHGSLRIEDVLPLFDDQFVRHKLAAGSQISRRALHVLLAHFPSLKEKMSWTLDTSDSIGNVAAESSATSTCGELVGTGGDGASVFQATGSQDVMHVLADTSVKSWRDRLACLQSLRNPDCPRCPAFWPQLVLQAEDDHPAVSAESMNTIARLAAGLGDPGDHLATRLAAALRAKVREGKARGVEAARACVTSLASHGGLAVGPLTNFLVQAIGCARERARSAILQLHMNVSTQSASDSGEKQVAVEELFNLACGQRQASRKGVMMTPNSRSSAPCTPSSGGLIRAVSASPGKAFGASMVSPVEHVTPSMFPLADFSPEPAEAQRDYSHIAAKTPASRTPSRYAQPMPSLSPDVTCSTWAASSSRVGAKAPASKTPTRYAHLFADSPNGMRDVHTGAAAAGPPTAVGGAVSGRRPPQPPMSPGVQSLSAMSGPSTPQRMERDPLSPQRHVLSPESSAQRKRRTAQPETQSVARTPPRRTVSKQLLYGQSSTPAPRPSTLPPPLPAPDCQQDSCQLGEEESFDMDPKHLKHALSSASLGPQLQADSRFLSPSRTQLSITSCASAISRAPSVGVQDESVVKEEHVVGMVNAFASGLRALEAGDDLGPWRRTLRRIPEWQAMQSTGDTDVVVEMLLKVAPRLPPEQRPELWCALSELKDASWFPSNALLELSVDHCTVCLEPTVVAKFLAGRVGEGTLSPSSCVDFCLQRLLALGAPHVRLARLLHALMTALNGAHSHMLTELSLSSLPGVVEQAVAGRLAASCLSSLCPAMELILRHVEPTSVPERSWALLRRLLRDPKPVPTAQLWAGEGASVHDPEPTTDCTAQHTLMDTTAQQIARGSNNAELSSSLGRLHRLSVELAKAEGEDVPATLHLIMQVLARPQLEQPLRSLLRRLHARQRTRSGVKENLPPAFTAKQPPPANGGSAAGEFLEADYRSVREIMADEGLVGAFPLSLLGSLRRLLLAPATAGAQRAAIECLGVVAAACGHLLLKILLQMFAGVLLRLAATRGPVQHPARATLRQFVSLSDTGDRESESTPRWFRFVWRALSQTLGRRSGGANDPALFVEALRFVCEILPSPGAVAGAADAREIVATVAPALQDKNAFVRSAAAKTMQILSQTRGEDVLHEDVRTHPLLTTSVKAAAMSKPSGLPPTPGGSLLSPPPPRSSSHRSPSPAKSSFISNARSGPGVAGDNQAPPLSSQPRRLHFSPLGEELNFEVSPQRSVPTNAIGPRCASPTDADVDEAARSVYRPTTQAINDKQLSSSSSVPCLFTARKLAAEARAAEAARTTAIADASALDGLAVPYSVARPASCRGRSPEPRMGLGRSASADAVSMIGGSVGRELESDLLAWCAELAANGYEARSADWGERVKDLNNRFEDCFLRLSGVDVAPVILATLRLCEQLVQRAAHVRHDCQQVLIAAAGIASAARAAFAPATLRRGLCAASAAPAFRSALRALALLQQVSSGGTTGDATKDAVASKNVASRALLELPPMLASLIDNVEPAAQVVAWVRVAGDILVEGVFCPARANGEDMNDCGVDTAAMRRWALRFCARCLERSAPLLPEDGLEFPAWEVLSELSRLHAQRAGLKDAASDYGEADYGEWYDALEAAASIVSKRCPVQAQEFVLLAECAGNPLPPSLRSLI